MTDFAQKTDTKAIFFASNCKNLSATSVTFIQIDESAEGQRLDNFLLTLARGVPKSHIYRVVRSGEVRVNKKRAKVDTRLNLNDLIRVPPLRVGEKKEVFVPPLAIEDLTILFEDTSFLIVDKPTGLASHGGSGISFGLIERLRATRPDAPFLELAHRLDRDTSGLIVVAKTRKALTRFQAMQREGGKIEKHYRVLVQGDWVNEREHVKAPLLKYTLSSGERRVKVDEKGLPSHTIFTLMKRFGAVSYLDAELKTGRTHQIRVHAASVGFPIVGDDKYGAYDFNEAVQKGSLGVPFKRLFLHAYGLDFIHPISGEPLHVIAPLPRACETLLAAL